MKAYNMKTPISRSVIATMTVLAASQTARAAELPRPDAILFGRVAINGEDVSHKERGVVVIARRAGSAKPVATYRMGTLPNAGDHFVLRIPLSVQGDGVTPSPGRAAPGESLELYLSTPLAKEIHAGTATVPDSGDAVRLDLPTTGFSAQPVPLGPNLCGAGAGGCGAVGLVSMWMMCFGLNLLKHRPFFPKVRQR